MGNGISTEVPSAQEMAQLANHAYHLNSIAHDMAALYEQLKQINYTLVPNPHNPFYDQPSGHHGYIVVRAITVVISIRGSGAADDWRNNLRYWQEPYPAGGHVHAGFALAAQGLMRTILAEFARAPELYANKSLFLTGHSSPWAVALLIGQQLAAHNIAVSGIFSFGAPRVGDTEFVRSYPLRQIVRAYVTIGDLVPLLPMPWIGLHPYRITVQPYQHVVKPKLLVGKTVSLRSALAYLRRERATLPQKIIGALIEFSPHSLLAAYISILRKIET